MRLSARVGIHTGPVVIGRWAAAPRARCSPGTRPNIAARLEAVAAADTW